MRVKTERQSQRILDAAAALFGRRRFHEVRMDDIAEEGDLGKGTLYRYFPDKDELYLALVKRSSDQYLDAIRAAATEPGDPESRLERVVAAIIAYFDNRPHLFALIQRAEVMHHGRTPFSWLKARTDALDLILELFAAGRRVGQFRLRNPRLTAQLLLGSLRSVIRFGPFPRPSGLAREIVDQFLFGGTVRANGKPSRTERISGRATRAPGKKAKR